MFGLDPGPRPPCSAWALRFEAWVRSLGSKSCFFQKEIKNAKKFRALRARRTWCSLVKLIFSPGFFWFYIVKLIFLRFGYFWCFALFCVIWSVFGIFLGVFWDFLVVFWCFGVFWYFWMIFRVLWSFLGVFGCFGCLRDFWVFWCYFVGLFWMFWVFFWVFWVILGDFGVLLVISWSFFCDFLDLVLVFGDFRVL